MALATLVELFKINEKRMVLLSSHILCSYRISYNLYVRSDLRILTAKQLVTHQTGIQTFLVLSWIVYSLHSLKYLKRSNILLAESERRRMNKTYTNAFLSA